MSTIGNTSMEVIRTGRFTVAGGKGEWGGSAWTVVADPGTPTGAVLRVISGGGYEGAIGDALPCKQDDVFELTADHYGGNMAVGENSLFGLAFYNSAGQTVSQPAPVVCAGGSGWTFKNKQTIVAPANAVSVRGVIFWTSPSGKSALWQNLSARKLSAGEVATASGLAAVTTKVDNQAGQLTALSQNVTNVTATANSASASITSLMEVTAASNSIGLVDGGFETNRGWGVSATLDTPGLNLPTNSQYASDIFRSGGRSLRFAVGITSAVSAFNNSWLRVRNGQKIRLTYWARISGAVGTDSAAYIRMSVRRFQANGTSTYSYAAGSTPVSTLNYTWQKITAVYSVVDGDFALQFAMQCLNNNSNTAVYVDDVSVELIGEEGEIARAKVTNVLDVDGNISGTVSENDGVRSSFNILASIFRVISSASTGLEWQNGYLRAYSSAIQLVLGINFGASSNLCFWYGPNVGAASCTKSNGTIWFDNSGSAYFGGSLSAGILKNSAQTTVLTANPTISVGPFTTNGKSKTVTVGYSAVGPELISYYPGRNESSGPPPVPANDSPATSLALSRRYAGGSFAVISSTSISHSTWLLNSTYIPKDALDPNLPNGGWQQRYYFISSASITYTDTLVGTENFEYTATAGSGSFQRIQQNLSVTSVENP